MKYVVVKLKPNMAAVLDENGGYHAIKDRGYQRGQILEMTEPELKREEIRQKGSPQFSGFVRAAAAIVAVAIIGGGVTSYAAPVSTVTLDGASSVEYSLNMYDRVVGVSVPDAKENEEFKEGISKFSNEVKGMKIGEALDYTADRFEDDILREDEHGNPPDIKVSVRGLKKKNKHLHDELDRRTDGIKKRKPRRKPDGKPDKKPEKKPGSKDGAPGVSDDSYKLSDQVSRTSSILLRSSSFLTGFTRKPEG